MALPRVATVTLNRDTEEVAGVGVDAITQVDHRAAPHIGVSALYARLAASKTNEIAHIGGTQIVAQTISTLPRFRIPGRNMSQFFLRISMGLRIVIVSSVAEIIVLLTRSPCLRTPQAYTVAAPPAARERQGTTEMTC